MSDRRKNTPEEISEVALAYAAGKTIEARSIDGPVSMWYDCNTPFFNFYYHQFRVKKEPRMMYIIMKYDRVWHCFELDTPEEKVMAKLNWYNEECSGVFTMLTFSEVLKTA